MKDLFKDKVFIRKLFRLTFPIVFQSLMLALVAAADAFMLGSVDQNSMSAVSLATQIQFIQNMFIMSATSAGSILGAQYFGKKDLVTLEKVFGLALNICVGISIIFFVGCVFVPRYLMLIFTNEEALIEIGIRYLKIAGWSYLLTGISQCYLTLMKVTNHANMSAIISSGAVIINIILNAIFIYGLFGLPAMGVRGAAIATLSARILELFASILLSKGKDYVFVHIKSLVGYGAILMKDFMKVFMPILGASLLWGVGFTSYSAFMGHLGVDATAANSVVSVVRDLICCFCNGLAAGGGIMVGNELGAGQLEKGKLYGDRVTIMAFILGFACCLLMLALTPVVTSYVKLTDKAQSYLFGMMIIMAVYMIGRTVNTIVINGVFAAGGDTLFDVYSLAVTMWCIAVPLAFIGTFWLNWPVLVVYACTCLDEVGKIPWVMLHYKKNKWVKDLTRENI